MGVGVHGQCALSSVSTCGAKQSRALFTLFSLLLPSQLCCWAAPENREFLSACGLFDAFQSNNEAPQTLKLEMIRKVTKHVRVCGERENLLPHERGSGHPLASPRSSTKSSSLSPPAASISLCQSKPIQIQQKEIKTDHHF